MRIAVTGAGGQVVSALREMGTRQGHEIVPLARPDFDLAHAETAGAVLDAVRPDVLVSAAAFTAVDLAESQREEAFRVNGEGPGVLARETARLGIPMLHLSTDYVFDGSKPVPYVETDLTGPRSVYGASKLEGERAVAAGNPRHVVLRTAWVYSHDGKNFLRTMLRLADGNPVMRVVSDQFGCPTYAPDIAGVLLAIADRVRGAEAGSAEFGLFHMAASGDTSWAGFAEAIFDQARRVGARAARVVSIATSDYPTPAARPGNSRLACGKLEDVYGLRLPHWHSGVERCVSRIARDTEPLRRTEP